MLFDTIHTLLRLIHIVAAVGWVGFAVFLVVFVDQAYKRMDPDTGRQFVANLFRYSRVDMAFPLTSITTTLAGILLYVYIYAQDGLDGPRVSYLSETGSYILALGALFGLAAFGHGLAALGTRTRKYEDLIKAAGDNPSDEQASQMDDLYAEIARQSNISTIMTVLALVLMASARYA